MVSMVSSNKRGWLQIAVAAAVGGVVALAAGEGLRAAGPGDSNKAQVAAYLWADQPSNKQYNPSPGYIYKTAPGGGPMISRSNPGQYQVKIPGIGTAGGHAVANAYGNGNERCKVVRWNSSGSDQVIDVACFNQAGNYADAQFTLLFLN